MPPTQQMSLEVTWTNMVEKSPKNVTNVHMHVSWKLIWGSMSTECIWKYLLKKSLTHATNVIMSPTQKVIWRIIWPSTTKTSFSSAISVNIIQHPYLSHARGESIKYSFHIFMKPPPSLLLVLLTQTQLAQYIYISHSPTLSVRSRQCLRGRTRGGEERSPLLFCHHNYHDHYHGQDDHNYHSH